MAATSTQSPQSQLSALPAVSGAKQTAANTPATAIGRVVVGYIQGGAAAQAVVLENIKLAIEQSLKNNPAAMSDCYQFGTGTGVKAQAVQAGFVAVRDCALATEGDKWIAIDAAGWRVAAVKYTGKLTDASNAAARNTIGQRMTQLCQIFNNAFSATFEADKAGQKAKKAAKDAEKATADKLAADAVVPSVQGMEVTHHDELTIDQQAENVVAALAAGTLSDDAAAALLAAVTDIMVARVAASISAEAAPAVH